MAKTRLVGLMLLTSLLLLASVALTVQAQNQATVTILPAIGGTTTPDAGTTSYNDGATVTITQTASIPGAQFSNWIITANGVSRTSTDATLSFPATGGTTYIIQPVYTLLQTAPGATQLPSNMSTAAIVIILQAAGGTTTPAPGAYAFDNATAFNITATPSSGWQFSHWVISGPTSVSHGGTPVNLEPTDNPYNVNHGYGSTYYYQPVFTQTSGGPSPSPTIPEVSILAVLLVLGALIPVVAIARKRRTH